MELVEYLIINIIVSLIISLPFFYLACAILISILEVLLAISLATFAAGLAFAEKGIAYAQ